MRIPFCALFLFTLSLVLLSAQAQSIPGWTLVWSDEFNQADGTAPDSTKWAFDTGGGGWGNNELQTYTDRRENSRIEGGRLVIEARKETFTGADNITRNYTSARLKTQGKASWTYGRVEARIQVPRGQGLWPAFWMLGANITSVGWPACGEIDIMENIGREPSTVHGTIHGPGYSGGNGIGGTFAFPQGVAVADDFHVFAIEWETNRIRWFVDGQLYFTTTPASLPPAKQWVFTQPQFLLLNAAVGGNWPGNPDASTTFPQRMLVDYVRVYANASTIPGGNTLTNPGFEQGGLAAWTTYGAGFNTALENISNVPTHGGSNVFKVFGQFTSSDNYSGVYQDKSTTPGASFNADGWAHTIGADRISGANTAWIEISFRDTAANMLSLHRTTLLNSNTPPDTWIRLPVTNQIDISTLAVTNNSTSLTAPPGTSFVRYQIVFRQPTGLDGGAVLFDDLSLSQVTGPAPPQISNISPNGTVPFVNPANPITLNASSSGSTISADGIVLLLNGVDVSSHLVVTGPPTNRSVSFSGLGPNAIYNARATVTDANGLTAMSDWRFDTFAQGNFIWEAEDFDFASGQFINNPLPTSTPAPNSYFGRTGTLSVDAGETSYDGEHLYRASDPVGTTVALDFLRQKFLDAISAGDPNVKDYKIGWFHPGEWINHTRSFPSGNYHVYGRLSGGLGSSTLFLDRVTSGQGTPNQTTSRLGSFTFVGGGWQTYNFVPLRDTNGAVATINIGGTTTLRATSTGGCDPNFFMLIPANAPASCTATQHGLNIQIEFPSQPGVGYQVVYKENLNDTAWKLLAPVTGNGEQLTVLDSLSATQRFYSVLTL